jgi:hypothetical protein
MGAGRFTAHDDLRVGVSTVTCRLTGGDHLDKSIASYSVEIS